MSKEGTFSTPFSYIAEESFIIEGETYGKTKFVELDLKELANGEVVLISDQLKNTGTYRTFAYKRVDGELQVLDQSYNTPSVLQVYRAAPEELIYFQSESGLIYVLFFGGDEHNYGGVKGKYKQFTGDEMTGRCRKDELQTHASSNLLCSEDFAGYAKACIGEFSCPLHFFSTGYAECGYGQWQGVCLPDVNALAILNDTTQCIREDSGEIRCPLDATYLNALHNYFLTMDEDGTTKADAGRRVALTMMKSRCSRFCPARGDYCMSFLPSDFTNRKAVFTYASCQSCVYIYKCEFTSVRSQSYWVSRT